MTAPAIPAPAPKGRLGNGQLRRQVAEGLAARPGPHTVVEIAKDLGRSAGAVDNGALGLSRPGSTRILVIVSHGRYKGHPARRRAEAHHPPGRLGCLVIWIAPSDTAKTMTGAGWSSSSTPPPSARRSPARSPPAPAAPRPAKAGISRRPCFGLPRSFAALYV